MCNLGGICHSQSAVHEIMNSDTNLKIYLKSTFGFYYWPFHDEFCLALCSRVFFCFFLFFFQSYLALSSPRLRKRELAYVLLVLMFVYFARYVSSFFSVSLCQGLAAACTCGTPGTLLYNFFFTENINICNYCLIWR